MSFLGFEYHSEDYSTILPPQIADSPLRTQRLTIPWPEEVFVPAGTLYEYFDYAHPDYPVLPLCTCRMHIWSPKLATPLGTVVWCHGLNEMAGRYANIIGILVRARLTVIAPDQPGCGYSDGPPCCFTHIGQWLTTIAVAHSYRMSRWPTLPTFIIGHSLGGLIATAFAVVCPESRTGGLALTSAALSVSRSVYSGPTKFAIQYLCPKSLRRRINVPCVPTRLLRNPLPVELQSADRLNPLMSRTTNVATVYAMMHAGEGITRLLDEQLFDHARSIVNAVALRVLEAHPKGEHDRRKPLCGCGGGCRGFSIQRTRRRRAAKQALRRVLGHLYPSGPMSQFIDKAIRQVAAEYALGIMPKPPTECSGDSCSATTMPVRSQMTMMDHRRLSLGRGSVMMPEKLHVQDMPAVAGSRVLILHGTRDYVCPSTSTQESLADISGGAQFFGDVPLTAARERAALAAQTLHQAPATCEGACPVPADVEEELADDAQLDPLTFLLQAQLSAGQRAHCDRVCWMVRRGHHEMYRDLRRWREIGEGIAEWMVDKALRHGPAPVAVVAPSLSSPEISSGTEDITVVEVATSDSSPLI